MRKGSINRISKETQIQASLTIEGRGRYDVSTGIRFFDHMLELFAHHGGFDLKLKARGDLDVVWTLILLGLWAVTAKVFRRLSQPRRAFIGFKTLRQWAAYLRTHRRCNRHQGPHAFSRRSPSRVGRRFLRRLRPRSPRQCSRPRALWPLQPPQNRVAV